MRRKLIWTLVPCCLLAAAVSLARWVVRGDAIGTHDLRALLTEEGVLDATGSLANTDAAADAGYVLVDVRSPREADVSTLPGAVTLAEFRRDADRYRDRRVVTYCTVGVRSGWQAKRLRSEGFDAANFEASILGWAEAGLPLVTPAGEPTDRLHTYSEAYAAPAGYVGVAD